MSICVLINETSVRKSQIKTPILQPSLAFLAILMPLLCSADSIDEAMEGGVDCSDLPLVIPLDMEFGSAGFMYNLAEHPKSIRAIAMRLLSNALDSPVAKLVSQCSQACPTRMVSHVIYKVAPTVFLPRNKQKAECLRLEDQTEKTPMRFGEKRFKSLQALNEWIMEFSQGRGEDGKALYRQCLANCSPRYTFLIAQGDADLAVETSVRCGVARDRKDDRYSIATELRWSCAPE